MMPGPPEFLHRYRSLSSPYSREDVERILTKQQIRFSSPAWFNDPYDCKVQRSLETLGASEESIRKWLHGRCDRELRYRIKNESSGFPAGFDDQVECKLNELWSRRSEIYAEDAGVFQKHLDHSGVLSLSKFDNDILMWSNYADSHRGICLRFRRDALKFHTGIPRPPPYLSPPPYTPEEVDYSGVYPDVTLINGQPTVWYGKWMMSKSDHWRYEGEWRVILQPTKTPGFDDTEETLKEILHGWHPLPAAAVAAVVLGCNISAEDERQVQEWCRFSVPRVPLLRARKMSKQFGLEVGAAY